MADPAAMHPGKRRWAESPPDGGWGWVIVACCFMVTVCTRAVTRCISIFFVEFQAHFGGDYSGTAWIHSLVDCTTMLCAPLGSAVASRWSSRVSVVSGGLLSSFGLLLSSFCSSLEGLYLTLGVLTGVGFALCYTPTIATVGCYFRRRRALAYGVAMSGSGIGTFLLAPAVQLLIDRYSWRGALLILSAFVANLCVCGALLRPIPQQGNPSQPASPPPPGAHAATDHAPSCCGPMRERRPGSCCFPSSRDYRFLLLPDFLCLAVSFLFLASGCSLPFVYLVPYALSCGLSPHHAALLMAIMGGAGIVGNITFGWLTDRRLLPFSVFYGYFDGAYVALIPVVTSDVVGTAHLASALGVVYFLHAFPYLLSPPVGGWLVDTTGSYAATFFLSGSALLTSSLVISAVAWIRHCRHRAFSHCSRTEYSRDKYSRDKYSRDKYSRDKYSRDKYSRDKYSRTDPSSPHGTHAEGRGPYRNPGSFFIPTRRRHTEESRSRGGVQMGSLLLSALLLGAAVGAAANQEPCPSGHMTTGRECCRQCLPGEGVLKPCGDTQTVCSPCIDSETFSEALSLTASCQPCTRCGRQQRMKSPCTDSNDAVCVCQYGLYLNASSGRCEACTRCPEGRGMLDSCDDDRDTVCEECLADTFSDQESSTEPCLPCAVCDEEVEEETHACSSLRDTGCRGEGRARAHTRTRTHTQTRHSASTHGTKATPSSLERGPGSPVTPYIIL
ncbi:hypothetical protein NHX12_024711 [Muraenolepis orangiensis]|uniref:TNFR-Cys domain-containing protein n=1 Tax=Muraenolepis orangiensis TaxID=630683 RepID=A0A9Q0IRK7_9TELE|nr:hypothetical protein NHX12_024711 [Muraenolepis orangiensis]